METPVVPETCSREDELKAELRSARELLAVKQARDGPSQAFTMPEKAVAHPRHTHLGEQQLESLVERLEQDLVDLGLGTEGMVRVKRICESDEDENVSE